MSIRRSCSYPLGHLESPAVFVDRQPPMESILFYLCLFAGGQFVATRTFQKYRELVSQRVPIAHSRALLKGPRNGLSHSLSGFLTHSPFFLEPLPKHTTVFAPQIFVSESAFAGSLNKDIIDIERNCW